MPALRLSVRAVEESLCRGAVGMNLKRQALCAVDQLDKDAGRSSVLSYKFLSQRRLRVRLNQCFQRLPGFGDMAHSLLRKVFPAYIARCHDRHDPLFREMPVFPGFSSVQPVKAASAEVGSPCTGIVKPDRVIQCFHPAYSNVCFSPVGLWTSLR